MVKCSVCGIENPDGIEFCNECGTLLKVEEPLQPQVVTHEEAISKEEEVSPKAVVEEERRPPRRIPTILARLEVKRHGSLTNEIFEIGGEEVTLGRFSPDTGPVDIDFSKLPESEYISRRHARIKKENDKWFIEDLGSTNGVFVNRGSRITQKTEINDGDEIALGNLLVVFKITK